MFHVKHRASSFLGWECKFDETELKLLRYEDLAGASSRLASALIGRAALAELKKRWKHYTTAPAHVLPAPTRR